MKKDDGRNKLIKFLRKNMVWIVIIASVLVYAYISGGGVTEKRSGFDGRISSNDRFLFKIKRDIY